MPFALRFLFAFVIFPGVLSAAPLKVVTTTGMIGDLVSNIGGKHVEVTSLMGPGIDPHLYRATQGDIGRLFSADVIFYNGLHLEGKMAQVLSKVGAKKPSFAVADGIPETKLRQPPEFEGQYDPHIWFDVKLWQLAGKFVTAKLVQVLPAQKEYFENRAAEYDHQLSGLDLWIREQLERIPTAQRVLVTAHDAFGYFGAAYGVEVMALQGMSTATEYGLHDLKRLTDLIISRRIKAVFVESSVPKRFIESLLQGVRARGHQVQLGGELFSDAMGEPGTPAGTYFGMVRHNVETVRQALN